MVTRVRLLVVALVLFVGLPGLVTACGSDGGSDDRAQIESMVRSGFQALQDGDVDKYVNLYTRECRGKAETAALRAFMDQLSEAVPDFQVKVDKIEITKIEGDKATVKVTSRLLDRDGNPVPGLEDSSQEAEVVKEDGEWKNPDCSDLEP